MSNIIIPDGGNIGSASDPDAISIASSGKPTFSQGIANSGTIDAGTIGGSVGRASGYPLGQYEITTTEITSTGWTQLTLDDGSAGVKYEYGGVDLANSNKDVTVPSTGMYEMKLNVFFRDSDSARYIFIKCKRHTGDVSAEGTGDEIFLCGTSNSDIGGGSNTDHTFHTAFYYSLTASNHISWWAHTIQEQSIPVEGGFTTTQLTSFMSVRKLFDL